MRTLRVALPLALLMAAPQALHAQTSQVTVAILPFSAFAIGQDASGLQDALPAMITSEFSERGMVKLVERERIEALMETQGAMVSGQLDEDAALRVGQLAGAQYVVTGQITLTGNMARLDIRLADVETGQVYRSFKETARPDDFLVVVESLADRFLTDLELPERVVLAAELDIPAAATLAFSRGLDYERRGNTARAAEMYERTLELFPEHPDAPAALERIR